jgi:hypothetical protein
MEQYSDVVLRISIHSYTSSRLHNYVGINMDFHKEFAEFLRYCSNILLNDSESSFGKGTNNELFIVN